MTAITKAVYDKMISSKCEREIEELERQRMIELSKKKDEESGGFNG